MSPAARRRAWADRSRARAAAALAAMTLVVTAGVPAGAALPTPLTAYPSAPVVSADPVTPETEDGPGLRILLDDVDPTVARPGEPVVLRGRVVNDGDRVRRLSTVDLRAAWAPLRSRADVSAWVGGTDARATDRVLGDDEVGPVVAPGAAIPFTVSVPENVLDPVQDGATALAVELRAQEEDADGTSAEGVELVTLRTVLTVGDDLVREPLDLAWVVPLTLPADPALSDPDPTVRRQAWYAATGPGSPARAWLAGLSPLPDVTWLVDPALLSPGPGPAELRGPDGEGTGVDGTGEEEGAGEDGQETGGGEGPVEDAQETVDPPSVPAPAPGTEPEGDGTAVVTDQRLDAALVELAGRLARVEDDQLWWLPAGDADVAALLEVGATGRPDAQATRTQDLLGTLPEDATAQVRRLTSRGRDDVVWPALAAPSVRDVTAVDKLWSAREGTPEGAAAVLLPRESVSGSSAEPVDHAAVPLTAPAGVTALAADSRAGALLAGADQAAARRGAGAVAQHLLADTLTAYLEDPGTSRSLLLAPPRGTVVPEEVLAEVSDGLVGAPWLDTVHASALLTQAQAGTHRHELTGTAPDPEVLGDAAVLLDPAPSPLTPDRVRSLDRLAVDLAGLSQVLEEDGAPQSWEPVLRSLWSTRWRAAPDDWDSLWRGLRTLTGDVRSQVHINPSTINFLSDQGIITVTVVNDLPVAVEQLQVELVPDSTLLQVIEQPDPVSVGAQSRATLSFTARALRRGETTIAAYLTAPNGSSLGDDAEVTVRVQPTGVWIYWVLGGVGGVILVLGIARALRATPRAAAAAAAAARPTVPGGPS
ncbi:DUF6049 family protein [Ornithinimicrobium sp. LYQ103]|uniref:DUF6049 family protein n=1 Tax=Ornithinimicrobium sp. LYQ103 TaxID=3378796 RepID=UPI003854BAC4